MMLIQDHSLFVVIQICLHGPVWSSHNEKFSQYFVGRDSITSLFKAVFFNLSNHVTL